LPGERSRTLAALLGLQGESDRVFLAFRRPRAMIRFLRAKKPEGEGERLKAHTGISALQA
jgi:hypothetical protein